MNTNKDYLSEFEREFELDNFSSEYEGGMNMSEEFEDELENDFSNESNEELETHDEYELDNEYESDNEYELDSEYESNDEYEFEDEQQDSESENYLQEYNSRDQEFEHRIYSALSGEYENSFEMEQEIDRVLYEMEKDYFFGGLKKFIKKKAGSLGNLTGIAKHFFPGGTLASLAKYAGVDVRNLLKSNMFKKLLATGANFAMPGVGGAIAGKLLNSETPNANNARAHARQTVRVAKDAYRNMAGLMPNLRRGNIPKQISQFSRQALTMAQKKHSGYRGRTKKVIRINSNSIVVVKSGRVIIYS